MTPGWKKVIAGFDGRDESRDALRLAKDLARAEGAELHVAVVLPRGKAPFEEAFVRGGISASLDEELFAAAGRDLDGDEFTPARLDGGLGGRSAARALYEYAGEQGADAIVVGSTHRGKLGRVLPGSVGESLLRGAPCAVAVAPRGYARGEHAFVGLIGVAYDGSDEAKLALDQARRLAGALDAKLRVITVVAELTPLTVQAAQMELIHGAIHKQCRQVLDEGVASLGEGVPAEGVLEEGDPAAVLADQGVELDLLVIGSRSYGPVRSALVGAISAAVMRTAPCPVVVVARASEAH